MIRVFAVGDVMGRVGRRVLQTQLSKIRDLYKPDICILNGENLAGGFGITEKIYKEMIDGLGFDAITMGNHWHDNKEVFQFADKVDRLVLPANMENISSELMGLRVLKSHSGVNFAVMNFVGKVFMVGNNRSPFETAARLVERIPQNVNCRIVDMHAEASSEKQAMSLFLGQKVSLVYGTHCHVPTADERILASGCGFVTDVGLTGAYDSVVGMDKDLVLKRILSGTKVRLEPAKKDPWLCAIVVDMDEKTGRCQKIERVIWRGIHLDLDRDVQSEERN